MQHRTYHPLGMSVALVTLCWLVSTVTAVQPTGQAPTRPETKAEVKSAGKAKPKAEVKADAKAVPKPPAPADASLDAVSDPEAAPIRAADEKLVNAFDAGKVDDLAALFLPKGELIDEHGTIYQGQQEVKELLTRYFAKFPGVKLTLNVESIRVIGPVAIEEGTRYTTAKESGERSQVRYTTVRAKVGEEWLIASLRDFTDDQVPMPGDRLQPLAWLVGDWINESPDSAVKISYQWSEDKNFLLGSFDINENGAVVMKSTQRIGWDPLAGKIRSWMFDSDGGYADGSWTMVEDAWVIKSVAVMPDGQSGSATITMTPKDNTHFTMQATDRLLGEERESDFAVTVVKTPPTLSK